MTDGKAAMNKDAVGKAHEADDAAAGDGAAGAAPSGGDKGTEPTPQAKAPNKRRRKVNHACVYCRRSERPCMRCIKRNIGHLCHDEPREADAKKVRTAKGSGASASAQDKATGAADDSETYDNGSSLRQATTETRPPGSLEAGVMGQGSGNPLTLVQPGAASGLSGNAAPSASGNANQFSGFSDAWMTAAQNVNDMNSYPANYMVAPQVTHEFNLLSDFLHSGLLDGSGLEPHGSHSSSGAGPTSSSAMLPGFSAGNHRGIGGLPASASGDGRRMPGGNLQSVLNMGTGASGSMPPPPLLPSRGQGAAADKTREYYLQAADPSGSDNAEERMGRVLRAKYDAGLLRPFNYINGYARLSQYLDGHIAASSKQKILRTINQFRPKFREKAQGLTDMQLIYVEMWFERQLMDYDRVFASMAVPACCWRRTGEIFRGNKEMAELIGVRVDQLRDIALHEILTEESMVRYWEEFGTIAFDPAHETLLTACSLKNPSDTSEHPVIKCCFSFSIRRDEHKLPALIVGNFLPHDPPET